MKKFFQRLLAAFSILMVSGVVSSFFALLTNLMPKGYVVFLPFTFIFGLCAISSVLIALGAIVGAAIDSTLTDLLDNVYSRIVSFFKKKELPNETDEQA